MKRVQDMVEYTKPRSTKFRGNQEVYHGKKKDASNREFSLLGVSNAGPKMSGRIFFFVSLILRFFRHAFDTYLV